MTAVHAFLKKMMRHSLDATAGQQLVEMQLMRRRLRAASSIFKMFGSAGFAFVALKKGIYISFCQKAIARVAKLKITH